MTPEGLCRFSAFTRLFTRLFCCCLGVAFFPWPSALAGTNEVTLLERAQRIVATNSTEALALCNRAVAADTNDARAWFTRARIRDARREYTEALADATAASRRAPERFEIWQLRGEIHFRLGQFKESVADFDRFLRLVPQQRPNHWQRGISLYYAGAYEDGRRQFELHESVNPNDVENATWHFLCVARMENSEKARAALLKPGPDSRVPMKTIHALYAGTARPEDVIAAASGADLDPARRTEQLFYAHLYIGLHAEALNNREMAKEHLFKAEKLAAAHYMGDVARVHAQQLRQGR